MRKSESSKAIRYTPEFRRQLVELVRYRGLKKNLHRLEVTAPLINLFIGKRRVLRVQARCAC